MKKLAIAAILFGAACGSSSSGDARTHRPSATDLAVMEGLRHVEEAADRVITQIHWDAADKRLRDIGDALAHSHDDRLRQIKMFLGGEATTATFAKTVTPSCFEGEKAGTPLTDVADPVLVNRLLIHHDCAQSQLRLIERSESDAVQRVTAELLKSYNDDVRLLHTIKGIQ